MDFFKKFDLEPMKILKIMGLAIAGIIILAFAFRLIAPSINQRLGEIGAGSGVTESAPSYGAEGIYNEDVSYGERGPTARGVAFPILPPPNGGFTPGKDAEEFEVTEYNGLIETRDLEGVCKTISGLKARNYVVFESANFYDAGCNYSFKVTEERVSEILSIIEGLDPKEISETTYTIKRQVEDTVSEIDILKDKLSSIDETFKSALRAYDEITALATRTDDAESLARIIGSKIGVIERLSTERVNIAAQLERLERAKAEQLDRLLYTYFRINVTEVKFVDATGLKDSWRAAVIKLVRDVNLVIQDITLNLLTLVLRILQYALYLLIILIVAKYGWEIGRRIWKK